MRSVTEAFDYMKNYLENDDYVFPPFANCDFLETINIEDGCSLDEKDILLLTASKRYIFDNGVWSFLDDGSDAQMFCNNAFAVIRGSALNPTVQTASRLLLPVSFTDSQKTLTYYSQQTLFVGSGDYIPRSNVPNGVETLKATLSELPVESRFHRKNKIKRVIVSKDIGLVDNNIIKSAIESSAVIYIPDGAKVTSEIAENYTVKYYFEDQDGTLVDKDGSKILI